MRKLTAKYSWLQLVFGLVLVALGVLTIILAVKIDRADFDKTICIVWSVTLFLIAALIITFEIVGFTEQADFAGLLISGLFVGVGIFILAKQDIIRDVIATLLPYILISIGGVLLLKTIILAIKRINFKVWLLQFILGVIFLATGIVFAVVEEALNVIYVVIGVLFIVLGALELVGYITLLANKRAEKKGGVPAKANSKKKEEPVIQPEQEVVEVEAEPKQIEQEDEIKQIE